MEAVEIPATIMLWAMLKNIHLPDPQYTNRAAEGGQLKVIIVLYSSVQQL
jgi:hypothetical protein